MASQVAAESKHFLLKYYIKLVLDYKCDRELDVSYIVEGGIRDKC